MSTLKDVLDYWFETPNDYQKWFFAGSSLDNYIKQMFESLLVSVVNDNNNSLKPKNTKEVLAKIILLDQFPRHIYRNTAKAYEYDNISLKLSLDLLKTNKISELTPTEQLFSLMPLQHSENLIHKNMLIEFANNKLVTCDDYQTGVYKSMLEHTKNHRTVLELFGRYPKRNVSMGRESTPEECLYIKEFTDRAY